MRRGTTCQANIARHCEPSSPSEEGREAWQSHCLFCFYLRLACLTRLLRIHPLQPRHYSAIVFFLGWRGDFIKRGSAPFR